jgi:AcrR family transcriptional regulator
LPSPHEPSLVDQDRTARARIRDAAFERFAADGVAATSIKSIAADAGVSPSLVIHHFGSKEGLREACDQYVVERHRELVRSTTGGALDPLQSLREIDEALPLVRYLARTLPDGSAHGTELINDLVENGLKNYPAAVESGFFKPSDNPRERGVILVLWQLGMFVLHEHVERLLGANLLSGSPDGWLKVALPMLEILTFGVLHEEFYEQWRDATLAALEDQPDKETQT